MAKRLYSFARSPHGSPTQLNQRQNQSRPSAAAAPGARSKIRTQDNPPGRRDLTVRLTFWRPDPLILGIGPDTLKTNPAQASARTTAWRGLSSFAPRWSKPGQDAPLGSGDALWMRNKMQRTASRKVREPREADPHTLFTQIGGGCQTEAD